MTVHLVYLGTRYVHPLTRQIFRYIVVSNWQYYLKPRHTSSMLFNWSLMKLQGFALPLGLSTHRSSVSQFCVRHLIPYHQPCRTKNADALDKVYALKNMCQKGPNIFWKNVCAMHTVPKTWRDGGGGTLRRREGIKVPTHRFENTPCHKLFSLLSDAQK